MHVFEMVVLIVLIGGVVSIVSKFIDRKGNIMDDLGLSDMDGFDENGMPRGETAERLAQLEERVAVLEKIVTDEKYDLKREIDRL